jgi:hypothetical protein
MADVVEKDPDAVLDWERDWGPWLADLGDTIQSSTWIVPAGITKTSESNTTTTATVWLSGGTAGLRYTVTNRIVTAGGRTDDRSMVVFVNER